MNCNAIPTKEPIDLEELIILIIHKVELWLAASRGRGFDKIYRLSFGFVNFLRWEASSLTKTEYSFGGEGGNQVDMISIEYAACALLKVLRVELFSHQNAIINIRSAPVFIISTKIYYC